MTSTDSRLLICCWKCGNGGGGGLGGGVMQPDSSCGRQRPCVKPRLRSSHLRPAGPHLHTCIHLQISLRSANESCFPCVEESPLNAIAAGFLKWRYLPQCAHLSSLCLYLKTWHNSTNQNMPKWLYIFIIFIFDPIFLGLMRRWGGKTSGSKEESTQLLHWIATFKKKS